MSDIFDPTDGLERPDPCSASKLARLLVTNGPFPASRFIAVENVSFGLVCWEADLLVCSGSGYLYEIEIKISISDLKRDKQKRRWRYGQVNEEGNYYPKRKGMWFAMPPDVWKHPAAAAAVPDQCGVIVVGRYGASGRHRCVVVRPCVNQRVPKMTDAQRLKLAMLGTMRYWSRGA